MEEILETEKPVEENSTFDIKYRSEIIFPELADKAIKDNFDISVKLVF